MPLKVEKLKGENAMALQEQKLRHSEDAQDVRYKQNIKEKIAEKELNT
jgi:hypothetical protein